MGATLNGGGDQLARGAVRATFKGPEVTQEHWDSIFGPSEPKLNNIKEVEVPKKRKKKV
jgi:hypothetical protein